MTEDQYIEYVNTAMDQHISRDISIVKVDQEWENRNFARSLAQMLRLHGLSMPGVSPDPYQSVRDDNGKIMGI